MPTTSFPGALDTLPTVNAAAGDKLDTTGKEHDGLHNLMATAIAALEAKVGVDGAATGASLDRRVNGSFLFADPTDSTATIQAKVLAAQTTGKPLYFGIGTFTISGVLATAQSFNQPRIYGLGMRFTIISSSVAQPIFSFVGGSGSLNGGFLGNMTLTGSTATGVRLSGCNDVRVDGVRFNSLARGVHFYNDAASTFTEFNVVSRCVFEGTVPVHFEYGINLGTLSFHGSGFRDCVMVQPASATGPIIKIGSGCRVYNAPWDGTIFTQTAIPLVLSSTTLPTSVGGFLRFEGSLATPVVDATSSSAVYYAGTVVKLGEGVTFGSLFRLVETFQANADGSHTVQTKPYSVKKTLAAGANTLLPTWGRGGMGALVSVSITAPTYEYQHILWFFEFPAAAGGSVTTVANGEALNGTGVGAATFSVDGSGNLIATNASFTSSYVAVISVHELGTWTLHPIL